MIRRVLRVPLLALAALAMLPLGALAGLGRRELAVRLWCSMAARCVGLRIRRAGPEPPPGCLVAANHVGYLDSLALGVTTPGRFLVKSEIAGWPLFGALTRWSGGVFVQRDRPRDSRPLIREVARRLGDGDRVLLFPEAGVSPDGATVGAFRPMLFESCVGSGRPVVPVALRYTRPADKRIWAWIDEPSLWRHLWGRVLPTPGVEVEVRFGDPLPPISSTGRKDLAVKTRDQVCRMLDGLKVGEPPPTRARNKAT